MRLKKSDAGGNSAGAKVEGLETRSSRVSNHVSKSNGNSHRPTSKTLGIFGNIEPAQKLQHLLAAIDSFALVSKTDLRGVINYVNEKFSEVSGYKKDELLGRPHSIIRSPYHSKDFFRDMWDTIKQGKSWKGEIQNQRKDKRPYWVYSLIHPITDGNKRPVEYLSIRFDITDLKESNSRQAILLEKLNKANQELVDFSYHVAHDLKSPLRSIQDALNLLVDDVQKPLPKDKKETLGMIVRRINRLEHLISGLLELARADIATEQNENIDLTDLVDDVIELIKRPGKGIVFKVQLDSKKIRGEKVKFHQLFQNLLSNAVKFIDKPSGVIEIGEKTIKGERCFFVKDNGPGIDPKDQAKIFDLFVTCTPPTKENHNTGVGLATVKKIVTRYGGIIWVESTPAKGAGFFFTVPKANLKIR